VTASTFTGTLRGPADDRLADVVERMEGFIAADPDLSLQAGALVPGQTAPTRAPSPSRDLGRILA
jgi:hypothetical protein